MNSPVGRLPARPALPLQRGASGAGARYRLDLGMPSRPWLIPVGAAVAIALVVSGINPYERGTWLMEIAPILVAFPLLILTGRRFPLTSMLYLLIAAHAVILIVGGAYTYARVPLGAWVQQWLDLDRNPYDKLGHFAQGLVPALAGRGSGPAGWRRDRPPPRCA